jgi:[acyl-carrier-protein] S-malonyltransferase
MKKIAYIFPGQGSQYIGMGRDLYDKYPAARDIFDRANAALGFDLKMICFEGPKEELSRTDISQPAILTTSIAALRALEEKAGSAVSPAAAAGLSLGEYSALVAADVLSFDDALKLVYKRGGFMNQEATRHKGTMASILGLSRDGVERICKTTGCQIANLNCPGQIVISGLTEDINKAVESAKAVSGGKAIILDVSGPFHSAYMRQAGERLGKELGNVKMRPAKFSVVANATAAYQAGEVQIKKNLESQVSSSVLWEDSMRLLVKDGITEFLEIGPGTVLKGLAKRIDNNIKVYNIGKVKDIEEFKMSDWGIGGLGHWGNS